MSPSDLNMRYVAAALLAAQGGQEVSAANIKKILRFVAKLLSTRRVVIWSEFPFFSSVGIDAEDEKVDKVVSELSGKDIDELIKEGTEKLGSVPAGGAPAAAGGAPAGDAAPAAAAAAKEPEPESEEDDDMGFGLFD